MHYYSVFQLNQNKLPSNSESFSNGVSYIVFVTRATEKQNGKRFHANFWINSVTILVSFSSIDHKSQKEERVLNNKMQTEKERVAHTRRTQTWSKPSKSASHFEKRHDSNSKAVH